MQVTEVRINLCGNGVGNGGNGNGHSANRLKAFCSLTFDNTFVIRDVKLIDGNDGLFLAMPSRKLCDHCRRCGEKNHLRARFCNGCGARLDEHRSARPNGHGRGDYPGQGYGGGGRVKLHADIAHPINGDCRAQIERQVIGAYHEELERSKQPGYVPPNLDGEDLDDYEDARFNRAASSLPAPPPAMHYRATGTAVH